MSAATDYFVKREMVSSPVFYYKQLMLIFRRNGLHLCVFVAGFES